MNTPASLVFQVTAVLALLVLAGAAYALVTRFISERRQQRAVDARARARTALEDLAHGRRNAEDVLPELQSDRNVATGVLLDVSSGITIAARRRLQPVVDALGMETAAVRDISNRQAASRAGGAVRLGYMSGYAGRDALRTALQDPDLDVRLAAAQALAQRGDAGATLPILEALALPGTWPLQRATEILVTLGSGAIEPLRAYLRTRSTEEPDPGIAVALSVLGLLEARQAATDTMRFLRHIDADVRVAAVRALGGMGDPGSSSALCERLRDPAWEVRSIAAKALGQIGEPTCVSGLGEALSDSAWWVRFNAAQALYEIAPQGRDALESAAREHQDAFARDISRQILQEQALVAAPSTAEATS